jgi:hypothetical protein
VYVLVDREINPGEWVRTHPGILLITLGGLVTELFVATVNWRTFANVRSKRKDIEKSAAVVSRQGFRDGRCR